MSDITAGSSDDRKSAKAQAHGGHPAAALARGLRLLLVDDSLADRRAMRKALNLAGLDIDALEEAASHQDAQARMRVGSFDCVFLDHYLPDGQGTDLIAPAPGHRPAFIVISGCHDADLASRAFERGARDFLVKSELTPDLLRRSLSLALRDARSPVVNDAWAALLASDAGRDTVTGLLGRSIFERIIKVAAARAAERGCQLSVGLLDLVGLRQINEVHGRGAGDHVLRACASRLRRAIGSGNLVLRFGGDDFALIVTDKPDAASLDRLYRRLHDLVVEPISFEKAALRTAALIGAGVHADRGPVRPDRLLEQADLALSHAKNFKGDMVTFFALDMRTALESRRRLERELQTALAQDEFVMYYQPQLCLETHKVVGFEALIRWQHPIRGLLAPAAFLAVAEESGLMLAIGRIQIKNVCAQIRRWLNDGLAIGRISINISPSQFRQGDVAAWLTEGITESGIRGEHLMIELTETVLLDMGSHKLGSMLERIRAMGVTVAVDDFGTGYASLTHLRDLPLDCLKIDRGFVNRLDDDKRARAIVSSILNLGRELDKCCIAEGVERWSQVAFLKTHGAPMAQGYLFARPLPARDAASYLRHYRPIEIAAAEEAAQGGWSTPQLEVSLRSDLEE